MCGPVEQGSGMSTSLKTEPSIVKGAPVLAVLGKVFLAPRVSCHYLACELMNYFGIVAALNSTLVLIARINVPQSRFTEPFR